jgi:hypothetical protein
MLCRLSFISCRLAVRVLAPELIINTSVTSSTYSSDVALCLVTVVDSGQVSTTTAMAAVRELNIGRVMGWRL